MAKVCESPCGLQFLADNTLEEYRAATILTKEPETIAWIDGELREHETLLDIGANIGVYSLYAAFRRPTAQVYAVEPSIRNYMRLCENIALNGIENVRPILAGFSARSGIETLYVRDDRVGGSGSQVGNSRDELGRPFDASARETVMVFSVDQFLEVFRLPAPDLMKIDVDGAEQEILKGMPGVLASGGTKSLLVEVNRADAAGRAGVLERIAALGYTQDNVYNQLANHSRYRRGGSVNNVAENIVWTRAERA